MGNKEWDAYLNGLLGDFKPEGLKPDWDKFSSQLDNLQDPGELGNDPSFDENLKESFRTYKPPEQVEGWQRIQASLDAADKVFDEDIRKRIADFEPHYDPRTWPLFLQRLADSRFLGAKLIAIKVVEVAAVLLILLTVVNMGRMGKLPFDTPLYDVPSDVPPTDPNGMADNSGRKMEGDQSIEKNTNAGHNTPLSFSGEREELSTSRHTDKIKAASGASSSNANLSGSDVDNIRNASDYIIAQNVVNTKYDRIPSLPGIKSNGLKNSNITDAQNADRKNMAKVEIPIGTATDEYLLASAEMHSGNAAADFINTLTSRVSYAEDASVPNPKYVKQRKRAHTEFGIMSQADYNRLRMPEDRLNTFGREIVFPQQGIPSNGYGFGFTMAKAHPGWALESGLIYSSKNFKPGRKFAVGSAFDNGIVEFEAMRLQLVTLPLQLRYNIDRKGALKFYTLAGFGLNLIVQSNVDVLVNYHFPSLSFGGNPNNDPNLAKTIRETKRLSEHIRDGAPFSSKSFVSATAGFGGEYSINEHKTFFLQTALQYQIPDLEFSNNNGKHIRSVSIQAGVRTPLGN